MSDPTVSVEWSDISLKIDAQNLKDAIDGSITYRDENNWYIEGGVGRSGDVLVAGDSYDDADGYIVRNATSIGPLDLERYYDEAVEALESGQHAFLDDVRDACSAMMTSDRRFHVSGWDGGPDCYGAAVTMYTPSTFLSHILFDNFNIRYVKTGRDGDEFHDDDVENLVDGCGFSTVEPEDCVSFLVSAERSEYE